MRNLKLTEIIALNNELAPKIASIKPLCIKILHNITCNQVAQVLTCDLRREGLNPRVLMGGFDNVVQDSYSLSDDNLQMVIVMYDIVGVLIKRKEFVESLSQDQAEQLVKDICGEYDMVNHNLHEVPAVVWNTFTEAIVNFNPVSSSKLKWVVDSVNEYFKQNRPKNVTLIDIEQVLMQVGLDAAIDRRMLYSSKAPYSLTFWKEYATYLSAVVFRISGKLKKALILDCDNTLWKGILGEDGGEGIDMNSQSKTGQIFNQVQTIVHWLAQNGIIVGLCSKNNPQDVQIIIDSHPDMLLRDENIVIKKVNWNDKATNLIEIASELNIGIDSLVFVDDSSFEINLVREQLPMVTTLQVPMALEQYPHNLLELINRYFYITGAQADVEKTRQYKAQAQRLEARESFVSIEDYLCSLGIHVELKTNDMSQSERIAQLTQKTNQFNLTTKRYTQSQIEHMMINYKKYTVYSASVGDKFGDTGLTAVIIVIHNNLSSIVDSFLMSCRIMGRNIEYAIMNRVVEDLADQGIEHIQAEYLKTTKNQPVEAFYDACGFTLEKIADEKKEYLLSVGNFKPSQVNYIKI